MVASTDECRAWWCPNYRCPYDRRIGSFYRPSPNRNIVYLRIAASCSSTWNFRVVTSNVPSWVYRFSFSPWSAVFLPMWTTVLHIGRRVFDFWSTDSDPRLSNGRRRIIILVCEVASWDLCRPYRSGCCNCSGSGFLGPVLVYTISEQRVIINRSWENRSSKSSAAVYAELSLIRVYTLGRVLPADVFDTPEGHHAVLVGAGRPFGVEGWVFGHRRRRRPCACRSSAVAAWRRSAARTGSRRTTWTRCRPDLWRRRRPTTAARGTFSTRSGLPTSAASREDGTCCLHRV